MWCGRILEGIASPANLGLRFKLESVDAVFGVAVLLKIRNSELLWVKEVWLHVPVAAALLIRGTFVGSIKE